MSSWPSRYPGAHHPYTMPHLVPAQSRSLPRSHPPWLVGRLCLRARGEGVQPAEIVSAMDSESPKARLVKLVRTAPSLSSEQLRHSPLHTLCAM